ncbi:MAG: hypothetical protein ISR76_07615 [Planctomycetes bacterium]|nr:hypothetical protein [Planctomycetota bacterium]MBL7008851.1 hypothetical protein [Planctomycetota bacterium]
MEDIPVQDALGTALSAAGFRCRIRREAWWECLLLDGEVRELACLRALVRDLG